MQPIHYSFLMNLLILAISGFLAFTMNQPLLMPLAFMVMQHFVGRFPPPDDRAGATQALPFGFVPSDDEDDD